MKRALGIGMLCLGLGLSACSDSRLADRPFNAKEWAATREEERYVFTKDLLDRKLLIGKPEAFVIQQLGTPQPIPANPRTLMYIVDEADNLSGAGFLVMYIEMDDKSGLVRSVRIGPD